MYQLTPGTSIKRLSDGTFTEDDVEEFTEALAAGLLTDIYSLS